MAQGIVPTIRLVQTCAASPEQYDAMIGNLRVGYFRLRWGYFRVEMPDAYDTLVYSHTFKNQQQGCFQDNKQRAIHLERGIIAIYKFLVEHEWHVPNTGDPAIRITDPQTIKKYRIGE